MREELENVLEEEQSTPIRLSCNRIEEQLKDGQIQGTLSFWCEGEKPIKGKIIATDPRVICIPDTFQGNTIEISYVFRQTLTQEKEGISGFFVLVTNYGEYEIPFSFKGEDERIDSSMGEIKNLFHYTNLAKTSWEEAMKVYYSPLFIKMLKKSAPEHMSLYRGLSTGGKEQHMEEFLISINKKRPVRYELQETAVLLSNIHTVYKEDIYIHRNGWGYTYLELFGEGSFLSLGKRVVREEDFIGNVFRLEIYIDPDKLHQGKNLGRILLKSPYETVYIPVQVYQSEQQRVRQAVEKRRNARWLNCKLTEMYLNFRSKRVGSGRFKKEAEEILEALAKSDDRNPLTKLYSAHLYITQDKYQEAGWMLDRAGKMIEEEEIPVIYAYYLYLTTLLTDDEAYVNDVREKIERLYYIYENVWQISWLYMYLSKSLRQSAQKKWDFLKAVFNQGCNSPVMYLEAVLLLNYQPTLLMELSQAELRILCFGARKELLSEEVKGIVGYLALKEKEYRSAVCHLLELLCIKESRPEFLQAYCSILIRGGKTGERYAKWYELAILSNIKLTRLYESYMLSLNTQKEPELPRMVLMYFSYQQEIREEYGAYIYRYVYQNREVLEELYISYAPKIERYLLRKLYAGKINRDLGYLYEHILYPGMITQENAEALAKVLFYHKIPAKYIKGKRLIVVHQQLKEEEVYETAFGLSQVNIYNYSCRLFWEDEKGNRYAQKEEDIGQPYLNVKRMAEEVAKWVTDEPGLALFFCEENNNRQTMNWKIEAQFKYLLEQNFIVKELKKELGLQLLDFYYENEALERLDSYLEEIGADFPMVQDRERLIRYLVIRDYHHKAYEFLKIYGPIQMEPKLLVRVSSYMLEADLGEEEFLCWYIYTAFRKGKYNGTMLEYLGEHFRGSCNQLKEIFLASRDFQLDTYYLSERILMQLVYTKTAVEDEAAIFKAYVSGGAKTNIVASFLTHRAIEYMRDDREMEEELIREIERVCRRGVRLPGVSRLAYLRFYGEHKELMERADRNMVADSLEQEVVGRELKVPFLQEYSFMEGMEYLADTTLISYKGKTDAKVVIHYRKPGDPKEDNFKREEMAEVYFGTYVKEFVLFYGEEVEYYVTESRRQQEQLTKSGSLKSKEGKDPKRCSRYGMVDKMIEASSLSDYSFLEQLLEEYTRKEYMAEQVFYL